MDSDDADEKRFHPGKSRGIALARENPYNDVQISSSSEKLTLQLLQKVCHVSCPAENNIIIMCLSDR
jgi:hypothetical protein